MTVKPSNRTRITSRKDRGTMTTELVLIAPVLIFAFVSLVMMAGRISDGRISLQTSAQRGARAASLAASDGPAEVEANRVIDANLNDLGVYCVGGPATSVRFVDANGASVPFGPGAYVSVQLSCSVALSDLAMLSLPGSVTIQRQALELIDERRADP